MTRQSQIRTSQSPSKNAARSTAFTVGSDGVLHSGSIVATPLPLFSQDAPPKRTIQEQEKYLYVDKKRGIKIPKADYYFKPDGFHTPAQLREKALRQQSKLLLRTGVSSFPYAQVFVLWSGGNDSTGVTHYAMDFVRKEGKDCGVAYPPYGTALPHAKVLHVDTGTGVPETLEYIESMIDEYNYPASIYRTDVNYEELALQYGFPGPAAHNLMYAMLKKRPLRQAVADHTYSEKERIQGFIEVMREYCRLVGLKRSAIDAFIRDRQLKEKEVLDLYKNILANYAGNFVQQLFLLEAFKRENDFFKSEHEKKILLITGARSRESRRRMGIMQPLSQEGRLIWLAPFLDWDTLEVANYLQKAGVRTNPAVAKIHRSGECNCGSFAVPGELAELNFWYPAVGQRIYALQEKVMDRGFSWGWEGEPTEEFLLHKRGQEYLPGLQPEETSHMCSSCEFRNELIEKQKPHD